jgi:hypothetical protein
MHSLVHHSGPLCSHAHIPRRHTLSSISQRAHTRTYKLWHTGLHAPHTPSHTHLCIFLHTCISWCTLVGPHAHMHTCTKEQCSLGASKSANTHPHSIARNRAHIHRKPAFSIPLHANVHSYPCIHAPPGAQSRANAPLAPLSAQLLAIACSYTHTYSL